MTRSGFGLTAFGVIWVLLTAALAGAALIAGGHVSPFALLVLILPYWFFALRRQASPTRANTVLLAVVVVLMVAGTSLLRLWELGLLRLNLP